MFRTHALLGRPAEQIDGQTAQQGDNLLRVGRARAQLLLIDASQRLAQPDLARDVGARIFLRSQLLLLFLALTI